MVDLAKEIKENEVLVLVCGENYQGELCDAVKEMEKQFSKIGFVTLNKPYNLLIELIKKHKMDPNKFLIIDGITKTVIDKPKPEKNCIFLSSPHALTEMNITISKASKYLDSFIFDSLSALLIYERGPGVLQFIHSLTNSFKKHKVKVIFTILKGDYDSTLMRNLNMFADKILSDGGRGKKGGERCGIILIYSQSPKSSFSKFLVFSGEEYLFVEISKCNNTDFIRKKEEVLMVKW